MYLQAITLENYRKFEQAEIQFPDGLVGIIGSNGAGKSSLVEAIAWVLYGNEVARTGKEEIKRDSASKTDVCRVILDFQLHGDNYHVVRELRGVSGAGEASLFINNQVAAKGVTAVNELVEKTLKMDWKSFLTSFFARQKELNALTDYQPHKRKEVLARMLGIEDIEYSIQNLRADKRDLETKLETARGFLKDKLELEQQKLQKEKGLNELKAKKENLELDLKVLQVKYKELTAAVDSLKQKSEQYKQLNEKINLKKTESKGLEEQITKKMADKCRISSLIPESEILKPEVEKYEITKSALDGYEQLKLKSQQKQNYQEQYDKSLKETAQGRARIQILLKEILLEPELRRNLECHKSKINQIESDLETRQQNFSSLQAELRSWLDQSSKLKGQLEKIEKLGPQSICEFCLRPLGKDFEDIREHIQGEFRKLEMKIAECGQRKSEEEKVINQLKKSKVEILFQKEKLEAEHKNKMKSQGEYENLEKQVKEKDEQIANLRSKLEELGGVNYDSQQHLQLKAKLELIEKNKEKFQELNQKIKELPLVEKEIAELTQREQIILGEVQKLEVELIQLAFEEPVFKQKSVELENMRQKVFDLQLSVKDLIYQERLILQERESLEKQIEQNVTLEKEIKSLELERLYLEKLSLILTDFKLHLIGRIRPTLARVAKQLLAEMTEGKYSDLELDENYETLIYDNGQKFALERFSGGEKDLANLCLRLAISRMIAESSGAEFSFIILDEVFGSQDIQRKENILKALATLKGRFRQIFLITHIEDIKDSVDNLITVVENEDGTSQIVMQ